MKSANPQRYKNGDTVKTPKIWIIKCENAKKSYRISIIRCMAY